MAWVPLGEHLKKAENDFCDISGNQFFTVRLDGKNFNNVYKQLQQMQLFSPGYSLEYESIMVGVCKSMTCHFANVLYSYTQSDEITLLFSSTPYNESSRSYEPHLHGGRHDKLISLTSSLATQYFCKKLIQFHLLKEASAEKVMGGVSLDDLPIATFDARISKHSSLRDAFQMILWRSYDCAVNSVSTALRQQCSGHAMSKSEMNALNTLRKVLILHNHKLLPTLTDHQKYGTLFCHGRGYTETGKKKSKRCKMSTHVIPGQVVTNVKEGIINLTNQSSSRVE